MRRTPRRRRTAVGRVTRFVRGCGPIARAARRRRRRSTRGRPWRPSAASRCQSGRSRTGASAARA
eukprot:6759686-Prymnesium_polylepis.1